MMLIITKHKISHLMSANLTFRIISRVDCDADSNKA